MSMGKVSSPLGAFIPQIEGIHNLWAAAREPERLVIRWSFRIGDSSYFGLVTSLISDW